MNLDLGGPWQVAAGDDELRRSFADLDFDDDGWTSASVPGHWRSAPGLETADGPVLHRRRFTTEVPADLRRRHFVVFDGLFYQGDVWLDGLYLGDTEGYFVPHELEATDAVHARRDHVLAVELTCAPQRAKKVKRNLTGVFQEGELLDRGLNPGGIWRPVRLVETGEVRLSTLRVRCDEATDERARVELSASLDALESGPARLRTTVGGVEDERTVQLTSGANVVSWRVDVHDPPLWWPWALGDQPLVDVHVQVVVDDQVSDERRLRTGLRQVRMHRWALEVNGERLFSKGITAGPTRALLADATPEELARDVDLAKSAGLDLIRLQAHVSRPELYEAADRAGVLVWQDLPLQWAYARGLRGQASRQARAAVDLLSHHPSVAIWCPHNEPFKVDLAEPPATRRRRFLVGTFTPTWNKTVLDVSIARTLERADGTRPVITHAGLLPHPAWGTDTHLSLGWRHGDERELPGMLRRLPVLGRWVADFGAQSAPPTAGWMEPDRWPDLDWDALAERHGMQRHNVERHVPPSAHATFESWREATQAYQATLLRHHVEALRRLKYAPTGGFCAASLADPQPSVSTAVLDHERLPKPAFEALRAACAPVIVTADRPPARSAPGEAVVLDVHVVSDLRTPLEGCELRAVLRWAGGEHRWGFAGDVDADSVTRVGTLSFLAPEVPGPWSLELRLTGPVEVRTAYEGLVAAAS